MPVRTPRMAAFSSRTSTKVSRMMRSAPASARTAACRANSSSASAALKVPSGSILHAEGADGAGDVDGVRAARLLDGLAARAPRRRG